MTTRRTSRALVGAAGLLVVAGFASRAHAQNPPAAGAGPAPATVAGVIVDSANVPVFYAVVTVVGEPLRVTTDSLGRFRLAPVPPGRRVLTVRALGYQAATLPITLEPGQTVDEHLILWRRSITLAELTVVGQPAPPGRLAGFYERRRFGLGKYLDREDIDRRLTNNISDYFLGMVGVQVRHVGGTDRVVFPRCGRFAVFLDGSRLWGDPNENLKMINPSDVEAIEIYRGPSELPAEFLEDNCAAVVIWTR